jgi:hypothetical protein
VILQQKGCRGIVMAVNRLTGRSFAASVWETAADREASEGAIAPARREVGEVPAGALPTITLVEAAFVEMKQAAATG